MRLTAGLRPYGPLRPLGAIRPTTATTTATARFIRDQRGGGFFICWSCGCCPAVFVCGSDFAGFRIGSRSSGGFFWIGDDDLTFGFFGFFTGSAAAFVTLLVVPTITFLSATRSIRPPDGPMMAGSTRLGV